MAPRLAVLVASSLVLVGCAGGPAASWLALALALVVLACSGKTTGGGGGGADSQGSDTQGADVSTGDVQVTDTQGSDTQGGDTQATDTPSSDVPGDTSGSDTQGSDITVKDVEGDTVVTDVAIADASPDLVGDAGGSWDPCCKDGKVSTCFCPANTECNYGMFATCGDGSCVLPPQTCPGADVSDATDSQDAGGTWSPCCENGKVTTCYCPPNAICNFAPFKECAGGTCVFAFDGCPDEPDAGNGTWESCCKDGKVDTCFCPAGMACNYGMFTDCGNGTCTMFGQTCP